MECPKCGYILSAGEKSCPLCTTLEPQVANLPPQRDMPNSSFGKKSQPILLPTFASPSAAPRNKRQTQDNISAILGCLLVLIVASVVFYMNSSQNAAQSSDSDMQYAQDLATSAGKTQKGAATQKPSDAGGKPAISGSKEIASSGQKPPNTATKGEVSAPTETSATVQKAPDPFASSSKADAQPQPIGPPVPADLQLLDKKENTHEGVRFIAGHVRNNSSQAYGFVEISFTLKDARGNVIGNASASTNSLRPNEVWAFEALIYDDNAVSYDLSKLTGY